MLRWHRPGRVYLLEVLACCVAVLALFSQPAVAAESVARSPLKKIALIPVIEPSLTVQNKGSAWNLLALPGYVMSKYADAEKTGLLTVGMHKQSLRFGDEMSAALQAELQRLGYEVSVVSDVKYVPDDPEEVAYELIETDADAILNAQYFGVGLFSGQMSVSYVPRLNISVEMYATKDQAELYNRSIYYGADARKVAEDQIPSDPKYSYGTFAAALDNQPQIAESFRRGIQEIAALVAKQLGQAAN